MDSAKSGLQILKVLLTFCPFARNRVCAPDVRVEFSDTAVPLRTVGLNGSGYSHQILFNHPGDSGNGRGLKEGPNRDLHFKRVEHARKEPCRQERMSAQLKKTVVNPNLFLSQQLPPDLDDL